MVDVLLYWIVHFDIFWHREIAERCHGVFTLAWSGTGTGTGTGKNGLYGFNKNLSHCTSTGTGKNTSIHRREHFQDLKNGYQTHSSGPENVPSILPCPCSGAVWKVLIKTIQPILPGSCPGPGSRPSQCEYTIIPVPVPVPVPDQASVNTPSIRQETAL